MSREEALKNIVARLADERFEFDGTDILDILWLAGKSFQPGDLLPPIVFVAPGAPSHVDPAKRPEDPIFSSRGGPESRLSAEEPERTHGGEGEKELPAEPGVGITFSASGIALEERREGGLRLTVPGAKPLPGGLALVRAMRPLHRRVDARTRVVLDEEATVHQTAEMRRLSPVMCPLREQWLDLALLLDVNPSMLVWQPAVRAFRLLCETAGPFRDVRSWLFDTSAHTTATFLTVQNRSPRQPRELFEPNCRRAVVVVSDCLGPAWASGEAAAVLEEWGRRLPVGVLHLLPQSLWRQSALADSPMIRVKARRVAAPNSQLTRQALNPRRGVAPRDGVALPLLGLEPEFLAAWADLLAGKPDCWAPAVVLHAKKTTAEWGLSNSSAELEAEERVTAFRARCSPLAYRLAFLLAAADPLRLPLLRLIQETMLPESRQVHLAEVLHSGLLQRIPAKPGQVLTEDSIEFKWQKGVFEYLLDRCPVDQSIAVHRRVSQFVECYLGIRSQFEAILRDPEGADIAVLSGSKAFAKVTASILRRLGGKYEAVASRLATLADPGADTKVEPDDGDEREETMARSPSKRTKGNRVLGIAEHREMEPLDAARANEYFWDQLLDRIEIQKVIPVIGPGAITFGNGDDMLHPWLAQKVAAKCHLQFPAPDLPETLQQVVDEQRRAGATHEEKRERLGLVHLYVFDLLTGSGIHPGVTLYRLASIKDFQLFLTTSFDPLLARALEVAQPAARPPDWVRAISFRDGFRDLPSRFGELPYACVYHLLGKMRRAPDCALWDDEVLAFLPELDQHLRASGNLSAALRDSHLLLLGLSVDNWLLRFMIMVLKGKALSELDRDQIYLSESQGAVERDRVVAFFSRLTNQLRFIPMAPQDFIAELARRWRERHPQSPDDDTLMSQAHRLAHRAPGCIFVSYASPDVLEAEYIVKQLQAKGLLVWFDKQQLLPGQDWEAEFSEIVLNSCGVFLSLISDNTAGRLTGFNIKERNLAIERLEQFDDTAVFYIPIRIDEGEPLIPTTEPRRSKKIQAIRKPGGHLDDDFIEYLRELQLDYCKSRHLSFAPPPLPPL